MDSKNIIHTLRSFPEHIPSQTIKKARFDQVDLARGVAIVLMFLSHTVMALNTYQTLPAHALVPVHLITKFSSTLFFSVFGLGIFLFYIPSCGTSKWPKRRARFVWRACMILLWYKILTVVQMFQTWPKAEVIKRLKFKEFTDFVEVLNFYWLAILWIALILPLWKKLHWTFQFLIGVFFIVSGMWLLENYDFGAWWQVKAMLVEHEGVYCFGQFQRGGWVLIIMALCSMVIGRHTFSSRRVRLGCLFLALGLIFLGYFYYIAAHADVKPSLIILAIAKNYGKTSSQPLL